MYKHKNILGLLLAVLFLLSACSQSPDDELREVIEASMMDEVSEVSLPLRAIAAIEKGADVSVTFDEVSLGDMLGNNEFYGDEGLALLRVMISAGYHKLPDADYALMYLIEYSGNLEMIKAVLDAGVLVEDPESFVNNVVSNGQPEATIYVLQKFSSELKQDSYQYFVDSALYEVFSTSVGKHSAALENLDIFLEKGHTPSFESMTFNTGYAAKTLKVENLDLIMRLGGRLDVVDGKKNTLIHLVAKNYHDTIFEGDNYLEGVKVTDEKSAVMYQRLVDEKIDLNAVDDSGKTALIVAAKSMNLPLVELLLSKGVDKTIKDKSGKQAVDYVPAPNPNKEKTAGKDTAAKMLIMAMVLESGLTKEDFLFMQKRRMAIRKLLL